MMLVALMTVLFQLFSQLASTGHPLFSVSPKQEVYSSGESINLVCSAAENHSMSRMEFTNRKWFLYFPALPPSPTITHVLHLSPQDSGIFSCSYYVEEPGQKVKYLKSNTIRISVFDPLPPPKLSLDPPSRAVTEGDSLLIMCSTNRMNRKKKFHFYKDKVEVTSSLEESLQISRKLEETSLEASLSIPQARLIHSGEFACRYEEKNNSGWTFSPWSQKVQVSVCSTEPCVPPPMLYIWMVIPLVILIPMVPLAFYCGRKKSKAPKGPEGFQPNEYKEEDFYQYVEMRSLQCPFYRSQTSQMTSFLPLVPTQPPSMPRVENGPGAPVEDKEEEDGLYKNLPCKNKDRTQQ